MARKYLSDLLRDIASAVRNCSTALVELAAFRLRMLAFALHVKPVIGGAPEDDDDKDDDEDDDKDDDDKDDDKDDDDKDDDDKDDDEDEDEYDPSKGPPADDAPIEQWKAHSEYWKGESRRWEREKKRLPRRAGKRAREAERKLAEANTEIERLKGKKTGKQGKKGEGDDDDVDARIAAARDEAQAEADARVKEAKRAASLETQVTRLAARGIKDGDDDDADTIRFADPDDVLLYIQKAIDAGDIDPDEIFKDNGKVDLDVLKGELVDLAEEKPHWKVTAEGDGKRPKRKAKGDADGGKGKGGGKGPDEKSVADLVTERQLG